MGLGFQQFGPFRHLKNKSLFGIPVCPCSGLTWPLSKPQKSKSLSGIPVCSCPGLTWLPFGTQKKANPCSGFPSAPARDSHGPFRDPRKANPCTLNKSLSGIPAASRNSSMWMPDILTRPLFFSFDLYLPLSLSVLLSCLRGPESEPVETPPTLRLVCLSLCFTLSSFFFPLFSGCCSHSHSHSRSHSHSHSHSLSLSHSHSHSLSVPDNEVPHMPQSVFSLDCLKLLRSLWGKSHIPVKSLFFLAQDSICNWLRFDACRENKALP